MGRTKVCPLGFVLHYVAKFLCSIIVQKKEVTNMKNIRLLVFLLIAMATCLTAIMDCWTVFGIGCVALFVMNAIVKMD